MVDVIRDMVVVIVVDQDVVNVKREVHVEDVVVDVVDVSSDVKGIHAVIVHVGYIEENKECEEDHEEGEEQEDDVEEEKEENGEKEWLN